MHYNTHCQAGTIETCINGAIFIKKKLNSAE